MRQRQLSPEQSPHDVAAYCVQLAAEEAYEHTTELRAVALSRIAEVWRELMRTGKAPRPPHGSQSMDWLPGMLHAVARRFVFAREPGALGEHLLPARLTFETNMGDCDDFALAIAAAAQVFGFRATVAVRETGAGFAHVAAVVARTDAPSAPPELVIDPQLDAVVRIERGSPWFLGRMMPEARTKP